MSNRLGVLLLHIIFSKVNDWYSAANSESLVYYSQINYDSHLKKFCNSTYVDLYDNSFLIIY